MKCPLQDMQHSGGHFQHSWKSHGYFKTKRHMSYLHLRASSHQSIVINSSGHYYRGVSVTSLWFLAISRFYNSLWWQLNEPKALSEQILSFFLSFFGPGFDSETCLKGPVWQGKFPMIYAMSLSWWLTWINHAGLFSSDLYILINFQSKKKLAPSSHWSCEGNCTS